MAEDHFKVSNVVTGYEEFKLENVNFDLYSGDVMALVGRSGAGKSTLIKTLLGLKSFEEGTIWFKGDGGKKKLKKAIGYSSQENSLYPHLSIKENLEVFGELRGVDSGEIKRRKDDILEMLDIDDAEAKRVEELSGGMKKRADIAVTLLHRPDVIVFDEPFTGIDPPQREVIWDSIEELSDQGKITIITSHNLQTLAERCNKYGLIQDGEFYKTSDITQMMDAAGYTDPGRFFNHFFRT